MFLFLGQEIGRLLDEVISRSGDSRIKFSLCYLNRRFGDWEISRLGKARKKNRHVF